MKTAQCSLVALAGLLFLSGCSSRPAPAPAPALQAQRPALSSRYSYKFFVQNGQTRTQVNVAPQEVANSASRLDAGTAIKTTSLTTSLSAQAAGSGDIIDSTLATPASLVIAAAAECGMVGDNSQAIIDPNGPYLTDPAYADLVAQEQLNNPVTRLAPVYPPWDEADGFNGYYIFRYPPFDCDALLAYEELLVCTADKLAQLADTVSPLTWHGAAIVGTVGTNFSAPPGFPAFSGPESFWIMPPQSEEDKFIVRDLAISVLAHVPMFDSFPWLQGWQDGGAPQSVGTTCSALYQQAATTVPASATLQQELGVDPNATVEPDGGGAYGIGTYPPDPNYPNYGPNPSGRNFVQERQAFEAGILRGAGQLLHDLIRESVYADLAGAAAQQAAAADPTSGQKSSAGLASQVGQDGGLESNPEPYNSLAHVARTLFGRWETEQKIDTDPMCSGVAESQLLPALADQGLIARQRDIGATTSSQAAAEALFEKAGIVFADGAPATSYAPALAAQLIAINNSTGQAATSIANLVATLSASDLARAVEHNWVTFMILTNTATSVNLASASSLLTTIAENAELTVSTAPNSALGTNGIAIQGGLARAMATTDPMARSGPMIAASQCFDQANNLNDEMMLDSVPQAPTPVSEPGVYTQSDMQAHGSSARQDAFAVAYAIRSRLVKLRELADQSATATSGATADAQARAAAVAELGAWAGSGRMFLTTDVSDQGSAGTAPSVVSLGFAGVEAADLGMTSLTNVTNLPAAVWLVYGDTHLAECSANLSAIGCPPLQLANATWKASVGYVATSSSQYRLNNGMTDSVVVLDFPVSTAPSTIAAAAADVTNVGLNLPFYVVAAQDPSKAAGVGQVLGALRLPTFQGESGFEYGDATFVLSPMRRELLNDAFGLGKWVGAAPPQAGETSSAQPPGFCVENVPRDMFVPLQNDLTDSNDSYENSWAHYLSLAQAAAANADSLAQQLIQVGQQQTMTQETSAEQNLPVTGAPVNQSDVSIGPDGKINAGPSNGALTAALTQPTLDVLMFGSDPAGTAGATDGATLATNLGCPPSTSSALSALCTRLYSGVSVAKIQPADVGSWPGASDPNTVYYTALGLAPNRPAQPQACSAVVAGALQLKGLTANGAASLAYSATTALDAKAFTNAVQSLDQGTIQSALQNVVMNVDDTSPIDGTALPAHWDVTYNGNVIMDSDDPSYWPACLKIPASGDEDGGAAPCNFANPIVLAFNDMFRWDTTYAGTFNNYRTDPLGGIFRDGSGIPVADYEINDIRWRVEGVLWLAAAMSGDVRGGMFAGPMPAANVPSSGTFSAPANTVFSSAQFSTNGTGSPATFAVNGNVTLDTSEPGAIQGRTTVVDTSSRYFQWNNTVADEMPRWLESIYAPSSAQHRPGTTVGYSAPYPLDFNYGNQPFVHIRAQNADAPSDYTNLGGFFSSQFHLGGIGGRSNPIGPAIWGSMLNLLNGQQCQSPTGDFPGAGAPNYYQQSGPSFLTGLVASLKSQQGSSSTAPIPNSFIGTYFGQDADGAPAFNLYMTTYGWEPALCGQLQSLPGFDTSPGKPGGCVSEYQWHDQVPLVYRTSARGYDQNYISLPFTSSVPNEFNASVVSPDERLRFALNTGAPSGQCDAAWQLSQAMAFSCLLAYDLPNYQPPQVHEPPQVTSADQLGEVSAWLASQITQSQQQVAQAYVTNLPTAVVANALGAPGTLTSSSG